MDGQAAADVRRELECYEPLNVLSWKAPPLLIEWACERFRQDATPRPIERWWQLAAVAVAQRSEDTQFMVGDPRIGQGAAAGEIGNLQDEIKHLDHVVPRFPAEMRFLLAQGIARDREWTDDALSVYGALRQRSRRGWRGDDAARRHAVASGSHP